MILALISLTLAAVPALLFFRNQALFKPPPVADGEGEAGPLVSVLIPARDEEGAIGEAVRSVLASAGVRLEVLVMDDASSDRTAEVVQSLAAGDGRLHLLSAPPLPEGWNGKQHACLRLAEAARGDRLVFMDADVRLTPDALVRLAAFQEKSGAGLVSGFPRQITVTWLERLLIPLMHFILLGFLPLARMRRSLSPAYGAGNGQLFMALRGDYFAVGGHGAVRRSLHDGLMLPRAFRRAGFRTDLCDATPIASCRMYRDATGVWQGLAKNATEGMGSARTILPFTLLLLGGQVLSFLLVAAVPLGLLPPLVLAAALPAVLMAWYPRLAAVLRFHQPLDGALLHPFGILLLLVVQWYALVRQMVGRPARWKDRTYSGTRATP